MDEDGDVTDTAGCENFIVCKQVMKKIDFQGRNRKILNWQSLFGRMTDNLK